MCFSAGRGRARPPPSAPLARGHAARELGRGPARARAEAHARPEGVPGLGAPREGGGAGAFEGDACGMLYEEGIHGLAPGAPGAPGGRELLAVRVRGVRAVCGVVFRELLHDHADVPEHDVVDAAALHPGG